MTSLLKQALHQIHRDRLELLHEWLGRPFGQNTASLLRYTRHAYNVTVYCIQRCEFSLTLRFFLRLSQRQDKVYDRWFLFLSSFWIKAPSKRYRRSIVLGLSSASQSPCIQMCIDTDTDTLMRKRSRTRQAKRVPTVRVNKVLY